MAVTQATAAHLADSEEEMVAQTLQASRSHLQSSSPQALWGGEIMLEFLCVY